MIASLDMYDLPEIREATDAWWAALVRGFRDESLSDAPETLSRLGDESTAWARSGLFFTQICGYPLRKRFKTILRVVGAPCYSAEGCAGPHYSSAVIVRRGAGIKSLAALKGRRLAYNSPLSQSGMSAFRALLSDAGAQPGFFAQAIMSGGHRNSIALVVNGVADTAAIDCVTWALLQKHAPEECSAVEVLTWTPDAPGLPYAVPAGTSDATVDALRRGIVRALQNPEAEPARESLLISGFSALTDHDYVQIDEMETRAAEKGLPSLF